MSNNTKIFIKNAEGDPALVIGLSIFAYKDFKKLSDVISNNIDESSAATTKKKIIDAIMSKNQNFRIAKTYRKSIDIMADRDTDDHNTLVTDPISSQIDDISILQATLDKMVVEDDIELSDSSKASDDLVKTMYSVIDKSDGDLFDAYKDAKQMKGYKEDDSEEASKAAPKKGTRPNPFDIPEEFDGKDDASEKGTKSAISDAEGEKENNATDSKDLKTSKSLDTKESDDAFSETGKKDADLDDKDLAIKKALPFSKFNLDNVDKDSNDFTKKSLITKIITPDDEKGKEKKYTEDAKKEDDDKRKAIKDALPFSSFDLDKHKLNNKE